MHADKTKILKRIAIALERIADCLEKEDVDIQRPDGRETNTEAHQSNKAPDENMVSIVPQPDNEGNVLAVFLKKRDIQIKTIPQEEASDSIINYLSEFLARNFDSLKDFHSLIKRAMQNGRRISLDMKKYTQKDVGTVCQFALDLHKIAFLEEFSYSKSPDFLLRAKTTKTPIALSFFSGKWLERFVLSSVQRAVKFVSEKTNRMLQFDYILNAQVILPKGDDFELDLLFHLDGVYYWIEAKSGEYQQYISKYSEFSKILKPDHSIMVLPGIPPTQAAALTSLFSMMVVPSALLEQHLVSVFSDQLAQNGLQGDSSK